MKKKHVSYDTLLIVASNLTLAEVQATSPSNMQNRIAMEPTTPQALIIDMFSQHVSRLEAQLDTSEEIL